MLTTPHRQESLCRAYVQAVAAQVGVGFTVPGDDYGVDVTLRLIGRQGDGRRDAGVTLDLQLKSTTRALVDDESVAFDLDVKNYDDLRDPEVRCPRLLVLLVQPQEEGRWLTQSEEELTVRHCAYWISLRGRGPTENQRTVRVRIPRANVFTVEGLRALLERVRTGEDP